LIVTIRIKQDEPQKSGCIIDACEFDYWNREQASVLFSMLVFVLKRPFPLIWLSVIFTRRMECASALPYMVYCG